MITGIYVRNYILMGSFNAGSTAICMFGSNTSLSSYGLHRRSQKQHAWFVNSTSFGLKFHLMSLTLWSFYIVQTEFLFKLLNFKISLSSVSCPFSPKKYLIYSASYKVGNPQFWKTVLHAIKCLPSYSTTIINHILKLSLLCNILGVWDHVPIPYTYCISNATKLGILLRYSITLGYVLKDKDSTLCSIFHNYY